MTDIKRKNDISGKIFSFSEDLFEPELHNLMSFKVRKVLLVASFYDYFMLEEDGRLTDLLGQDYKEHDLGYVPILQQIDDGESALKELETNDFDLVITLMRLKDMDPFVFGRRAKRIKPDLPVVILSYNKPDLQKTIESTDNASIDRVFVWQGDGKILVAIIKYIEDMKNARLDNEIAGVQSILLVEDSVQFYSKYLYTLYDELWYHIDRLLKENSTYTERRIRQRKRPKVLLATNYDEALDIYNSFKGNLMGIITDLGYPVDGERAPDAGLKFARLVRSEFPTLPILIQSSETNRRQDAEAINASFLNKNSPTLSEDFRHGLNDLFLFHSLVFRDKDCKMIARATDIPTFLKVLNSVPDDVIKFYLDEGLITRWMRSRTNFLLAEKVDEMPRDGAEGELRTRLSSTIRKHVWDSYQGSISRYTPSIFKVFSNLCKIGNGSIGGKGRGLAFIDRILAAFFDKTEFEDIDVSIPPTVLIGTDFFEEFLFKNELHKFAIEEEHTDEEITRRFVGARLPDELQEHLSELVIQMTAPIAVRSSSLLEDTLYQPFAGIFITQMLPNNEPREEDRQKKLEDAIKLVYASTFFKQARSYIENTAHRVEDEKMAVVIQEVIGKQHGDFFYPDFSGVGRSYNYYPFGEAKPEDGTVNLALGLGKSIVDGGASIRYTPAYPGVLPQFANIQDMLSNSQKEFWAINLKDGTVNGIDKEDQFLLKRDISDAEADGVLDFIASTYSWDNDQIYDGIGRPGPRIVTFAHILKNEIMPLSRLLIDLMNLCEQAMGCPIEIEFAVNLDSQRALPARFGFLQMRPIVDKDELVEIRFEDYSKSSMLCCTDSALGNGVLKEIQDIVVIRPEKFDAAKTPQMAEEVGQMNMMLKDKERPYILIGPGRWGSTESWLGIPVKWGQIDGAKVIVEAALETMNPDPSQGSHFFQNITSLRIGYFSVPLQNDERFVDWDWLQQQKSQTETEYVKHILLESPVRVMIDGRKGSGIILKPDILGIISRLFPI